MYVDPRTFISSLYLVKKKVPIGQDVIGLVNFSVCRIRLTLNCRQLSQVPIRGLRQTR